ncbi:MAG: dienelactone hydrolase family protein [Anaerolineales bacterium]
MNEQNVAVPRSGRKALEAFLVYPEGGDQLPGMVVVHEILGLNDDIRDIARRFASAGYAALAVDLFSTGSRAICMLRIFHGMLIRPLNNGVVGDLRATQGRISLPARRASWSRRWSDTTSLTISKSIPVQSTPSSTRAGVTSRKPPKMPGRG